MPKAMMKFIWILLICHSQSNGFDLDASEQSTIAYLLFETRVTLYEWIDNKMATSLETAVSELISDENMIKVKILYETQTSIFTSLRIFDFDNRTSATNAIASIMTDVATLRFSRHFICGSTSELTLTIDVVESRVFSQALATTPAPFDLKSAVVLSGLIASEFNSNPKALSEFNSALACVLDFPTDFIKSAYAHAITSLDTKISAVIEFSVSAYKDGLYYFEDADRHTATMSSVLSKNLVMTALNGEFEYSLHKFEDWISIKVMLNSSLPFETQVIKEIAPDSSIFPALQTNQVNKYASKKNDSSGSRNDNIIFPIIVLASILVANASLILRLLLQPGADEGCYNYESSDATDASIATELTASLPSASL